MTPQNPNIPKDAALVNFDKPRHNPFLLFLYHDRHYVIWARRFTDRETLYSPVDFILTNYKFGNLTRLGMHTLQAKL